MDIDFPENIQAFNLANGKSVYGVGTSGQEITLSLESIHADNLNKIVARDHSGKWAGWMQPADIRTIETYLKKIRGVPVQADSTEKNLQSTFHSLIRDTLKRPLEVSEKLEGMMQMNLLPEASKLKIGIAGILNDAKRLSDQGGQVTPTILREDILTMLEGEFGIKDGNIDTIDDGVSNEARALIEYLLGNIKISGGESPKERARIERVLTTVLKSAFGLIKKSPNSGDTFDPKTMNVASVIDTTRNDEHKTIDEVVTDGYGYIPGMARVLEQRINEANGIQENNELNALKSSKHVVQPRVRVFVKKQ